MDKIDPRYDSYIQIYNSFDNVLWKIPTILLAGSAIMAALIGNIIGSCDSSSWVTSQAWIGISLLLFGMMFLVAGISTKAIYDYLEKLGENLKPMEEQVAKDNGFFHHRHSSPGDGFIRACYIGFVFFGYILMVIG